MIFIHHDSVVVLTTRHTATSWVLAMFPNSTVTGGDVSTLLAVFVSARKERKKERKKRVRFVSRSQKRRREKKENDIEIGARKARERVPTPIKPRASRETKPPSRVKTSKRRFQTSRRNAFPQHLRFRRQVPGLFPTLRRKRKSTRARSSPPPANATAALYPSRDLRTRRKTTTTTTTSKTKRYSQVRRHPRVTLL